MYKVGAPLLNTSFFFRLCSFLIFKITLLMCMLYGALILRIRFIGRDNIKSKRSCLLISNHVLSLDPGLLAAMLGWRKNAYFTQLEETTMVPFLGTYTRLLGGVAIPRQNTLRRIEREILAQAYRYKEFVHCFPEGECYLLNQEIMPFQIGFFYLAIKQRIPIIPIVFILHRQYWFGRERINFFNKKIEIPPKVTLRILNPIEPPIINGKLSANNIQKWSEEIRHSMQNAIDTAQGDKSLSKGKMPRLFKD